MAEFVPMKDVRGYLTLEQCKVLLSKCRNRRDKLLFMTLFYSGRRISEVVRSLKPEHIDAKNNMIAWRILKKNPRKRDYLTGKILSGPKPPAPYKYKYAPPKLIRSLKSYIRDKKISPKQYVFPISDRRVRYIFTQVGKDAGIERVGEKPLHPHHLRHSFAVEGAKKANSPMDIVLLQNALDHSKIDTTMHYLQFNPKRQKELMDKMWKE